MHFELNDCEMRMQAYELILNNVKHKFIIHERIKELKTMWVRLTIGKIKPEKLDDIMSNFEKYLNYDDKDIIVQAAIVHAQFEIIHPFLDGNGRIGRMLIPLLFYSRKAISDPVFYISSFFEKNRDEYYKKLNIITSSGNWNDWIAFFINAVTTNLTLIIRNNLLYYLNFL